MKKNILPSIDKTFLGVVITIFSIGILIFISASLSELTKNPEVFQRMIIIQILFGLIGIVSAVFIVSKIPYNFWKKNALYLLIFGFFLMLLVYVPGLGFEHGGARRWISLGFVSFQPAEFLKYAVLIYWSSWLAFVGKKIKDYRFGLVPFAVLVFIIAILMLTQPDTDGFIVLAGAMFIVYFLAGAPLKHLALIFVLALVAGGALVAVKPYLFDRVKTYLDPNHDPIGSSYQIRQSLIAVGSGGVFGRGFGQSVQKFDYLPEPVGDSIFAVYAEEFGFIGSTLFIALYILFLYRGYLIASRSADIFAKYLVFGIIGVIVLQSFINIGSVIGAIPFAGLPLLLVSHGGTALFITLIFLGVIMQISRYQTIPKDDMKLKANFSKK